MTDQEVDPPYSRLFVIGVKDVSAKAIENHFEQYGEVEKVYKIYKKHHDGAYHGEREDKGVCYVKFTKTTAAAKAMEELANTSLESGGRPLKIVVASNRDGGANASSDLPMDLITKVFIQTTRTATEEEIREEFNKYGAISRIKRILDHKTGQPRGFAYVWYDKFSDAAYAVENAPKEFRAIFARPQEQPAEKRGQGRGGQGYSSPYSYGQDSDQQSYNQSYGYGPPLQKMGRFDGQQGLARGSGDVATGIYSGYSHCGVLRLSATMHPQTTLEQATKLFDLIPGLEYCDTQPPPFVGGPITAHVKYSTPYCASYAKDKLDSFEYPPGYVMRVAYASESQQSAINPTAANAIQTLTETLKEAANVLRSAGLTQTAEPDLQGLTQLANRLKDSVSARDTGGPNDGLEAVPHCSVHLPPKQPMMPPKTTATCRLFVVFLGPAPPLTYITDIFCRFGNFIDFFFVRGRNIGYALFTDHASATRAMEVLHLQNFCDVRTKVIWADDRRNSENSQKLES